MSVRSGLSVLFCALTVSCSKGQTGSPFEILLFPDTNICLDLSEAGALKPHSDLITDLVRATLEKAMPRMPVEALKIEVRDAPSQTIPELGIGGYNPDAHRIILSVDPSFDNLIAALESGLPFQLAHELHHLKRRRSVGYGATLFEAMVSEGLADHFAMEVTGKPAPPWATALKGEALHYWREEAAIVWDQKPYDHQAWFFGTTRIPRWAGYSIGFGLVRDYLRVHPGSQAATLHNVKARRFKP